MEKLKRKEEIAQEIYKKVKDYFEKMNKIFNKQKRRLENE